MRREAVFLVARRELTERVRERSFLVSTGVTLAIIALAVVLPGLLGFDERDRFTVAAVDPTSRAIAEAAERGAAAFDAELEVRRFSHEGAEHELLGIAAVGLGIAAATGTVDVDGDLIAAVGLSLLWFVLGYAFYACAFACAGALVPRLEELQSSTTPLTMLILVSLFIAFAVNANPDGTLAHVTAFIPTTAPMTLPPRILLGEAPAAEVIGGALVTLAAAAALIPLAARIYSGAVLRTGSAVKLRDAWRSARA